MWIKWKVEESKDNGQHRNKRTRARLAGSKDGIW